MKTIAIVLVGLLIFLLFLGCTQSSDKVCFDTKNGVTSGDFEKKFISSDLFNKYEEQIAQKFNFTFCGYGISYGGNYYDPELASLADITDTVFFRCYEDRNTQYKGVDMIGSELVYVGLPRTNGSFEDINYSKIFNDEDIKKILLPINSPQKAILFASLFSDASMHVDEYKIQPCALKVTDGYIVTMKSSATERGCGAPRYTIIELLISDQGEIKTISSNNNYDYLAQFFGTDICYD